MVKNNILVNLLFRVWFRLYGRVKPLLMKGKEDEELEAVVEKLESVKDKLSKTEETRKRLENETKELNKEKSKLFDEFENNKNQAETDKGLFNSVNTTKVILIFFF